MFNFTKKRAISLILVIAMLLGSLPADTLRLFSWAADEADYSGDVEKYAELNETVTNITVLDRENGIESTFLHEDFAEGTILCIADWYQDADAKLWYLVTFYSGGVVGDYAAGWPANPWVSADALVFVDCCAVCGKPNCTTEHSTEPVTVQGNLPEDATVSYTPVTDAAVLEELGIKNGFAADISILSGGAKWQPDEPVTVTLKTSGNYAAIRHYLDDVTAVTAGLADGSAMVMDISGKSEAVKTLLADAIEAYQSATNTTDEMVAMEWISNVTKNGDGTISFVTDSMSVYAMDAAGYLTAEDVTNGFNLVGKSSSTDNAKIYYAGTYYITKGTTLTITDGNVTANDWTLYWNDFGNPIGRRSADSNSTISGAYVSLRTGQNNDRHGTLTVNADAPVGGKIQVNMNANNSILYHVHFIVIDQPISVTFDANADDAKVNTEKIETLYMVEGYTMPVPVRAGYYFDGWYTAPEGGSIVGTLDQVNSVGAGHAVYTYPANGATTLYAHWSEKAEVTGYYNVIEIGLINGFYLDDTYTINGTEYDSLGKFPKEPSVVNHPAYSVYRVDNSNGYSLNLYGFWPLIGSPTDFIDESIMDSSLLSDPTTDSDGVTTIGVADETGALVRQFLKPGALDEEALIRAWLKQLIDAKTALTNEVIKNIEGEFNIDLPEQSSNLTNAHISEFHIIPYVVKRHQGRAGFGNISTWIIDMVIVPKTRYTLSYDMNPPSGYTAAGQAWDAVQTFPANTDASVYSGPDSTYKLSKVINGKTYYAEFLYWTDEDGNQYGKGYDLDILMDSNKVLTANWKVPDEDTLPGSLRVTKVVKGIDPGEAKFKFTLGIKIGGSAAADTYEYGIYNATGHLQSESGSKIGDGGEFALQNGWYIVVKDIPKGAVVTISESQPEGNYQKPDDVTVTILPAQEVKVTVTNVYVNQYTVYYVAGTGGSVNPGNEVISETADTAVGSTATANAGYKFVGWYKDAAFTKAVTSTDGTVVNGKFTPAKPEAGWQEIDNTTYYAKFEYNLTSLTIEKVTTDDEENVVDYSAIDPNQSFIFNINGNGVDLDVVVHGSDWNVVIDGLTVGATYTVTEKTDWSWRYTFSGWEHRKNAVDDTTTTGSTKGAEITLGVNGTITFTNSRSNQYWLDGDSWCNNIFK